ncbi:hypothetical protein ACHAXR_012053 [Thalassiosira sp. AJA248-18]
MSRSIDARRPGCAAAADSALPSLHIGYSRHHADRIVAVAAAAPSDNKNRCETSAGGKKDVPPSPILHLDNSDDEELGAIIYKSSITARKRQDEVVSQQKVAASLDRPVDISKNDDKIDSKYEYDSNHRDVKQANESVSARRLDKRDHKGDAQFAELLPCKNEHGDCLEPQPRSVPDQCGSLLGDDCIAAASSSEVSPPPHVPNVTTKTKAARWNERFRELEAFKSQHGHCMVPQRSEQYPKLGSWLSQQRCVMRKLKNMQDDQKLSDKNKTKNEHMSRLENLGVVFSVGTGFMKIASWEHQFTSLLKYRQLYGNCDVPTASNTEFRSLGRWVSAQRKLFRGFHSCKGVEFHQLSPERDRQQRQFQRMREVGFRFAIGKGSRNKPNPLKTTKYTPWGCYKSDLAPS